MLRYVDLFAGCGGLSLGLESVGFELALAVEKSPMAAETLYRNVVSPGALSAEWQNHLTSGVSKQAKAGLVVASLRSLLDDEDAMQSIGEIDVVAGGPPCQGFSLAGRRDPADARNALAWEFLEFVERTIPKAVIIENVVGMNRRFEGAGDSVFDQLRMALESRGEGYVVQAVLANAMHYGAAQHRPRMLLIGIRNDLALAAGIDTPRTVWRSDFCDAKLLENAALSPTPTVNVADVRTLADAIGDIQELPMTIASSYVDSLAQFEARLPQLGCDVSNQEPRRHTDRVKTRFRLYQWLLSEKSLQNAMQSVASGGPETARIIAHRIPKASFPARSPDGTLLAKNRASLAELLVELTTRKHSQRVLRWDKPSPTIVTLPDDYVHPTEPRILTVRESARLQGFPDTFTFFGKATTGAMRRRFEVPQYSQVGNAVSPFVGRAVGNMLTKILGG